MKIIQNNFGKLLILGIFLLVVIVEVAKAGLLPDDIIVQVNSHEDLEFPLRIHGGSLASVWRYHLRFKSHQPFTPVVHFGYPNFDVFGEPHFTKIPIEILKFDHSANSRKKRSDELKPHEKPQIEEKPAKEIDEINHSNDQLESTPDSIEHVESKENINNPQEVSADERISDPKPVQIPDVNDKIQAISANLSNIDRPNNEGSTLMTKLETSFSSEITTESNKNEMTQSTETQNESILHNLTESVVNPTESDVIHINNPDSRKLSHAYNLIITIVYHGDKDYVCFVTDFFGGQELEIHLPRFPSKLYLRSDLGNYTAQIRSYVPIIPYRRHMRQKPTEAPTTNPTTNAIHVPAPLPTAAKYTRIVPWMDVDLTREQEPGRGEWEQPTELGDDGTTWIPFLAIMGGIGLLILGFVFTKREKILVKLGMKKPKPTFCECDPDEDL